MPTSDTFPILYEDRLEYRGKVYHLPEVANPEFIKKYYEYKKISDECDAYFNLSEEEKDRIDAEAVYTEEELAIWDEYCKELKQREN